MKTYSNFLLVCLTSSSLILAACGGAKDIDKVAEAQNCLDTATSDQVAACVAKVDGLVTPAAYLIRCVGKFTKEGFNNPSKIANALSGISGGGSTSGSMTMRAALAFSSESTPALNAASAQEAMSLCSLSNSKGLILLSGLSSTSTTLSSLVGQDPSTLSGTDLQALMGTLSGNPQAESAVGSAAATIYETNCTGSQSNSSGICQQFDSAVSTVPGGTSNTSALGAQIMACYNNPATPGCSGF